MSQLLMMRFSKILLLATLLLGSEVLIWQDLLAERLVQLLVFEVVLLQDFLVEQLVRHLVTEAALLKDLLVELTLLFLLEVAIYLLRTCKRA